MRKPPGSDSITEGTTDTHPTTAGDSDAPTTFRVREGGSDGTARGVDVPELSSQALRNARFEARYEQGRVLATGGMGAIRSCLDRLVGREIVMKVIRPELSGNHDVRARFLREARVQGQLEHPSIVPVHDLAALPSGEVYFTMKRVRGNTLHEILESLRSNEPGCVARYSRRKLLTAFSNVCLTLAFAHSRGVLHRDLKPANIMLGEFGEVNVLDWGLAKITGREADDDRVTGLSPSTANNGDDTCVGSMLGTPGYMAPEQVRSAAEIDERAEVYALGAVLFELLTLTPLHEGPFSTLAAKTLQGVESRPSIRCPEAEVPPELEAICVRATAMDPAERYPSARELHEAVERYLDGDRDLELRRHMSSKHAEAARRAVTRVFEARGGPVSEGALDARREAMFHIGRALALDPENEVATETMKKLLGEPPKVLPAEVRQDIARSSAEQIRATGRIATFAYASLILYLPLFFWSGVRDWVAVGAFYGLVGLSIGVSGYAALILPRIPMVLAATLLSNAAFATLATLFGPLIMIPGIIAVNTTAYAIHLERAFRPVAILAGCLAILVPLAFELTGLISPSYVFSGGMLNVLPRTVNLPAGPTLAFLAVTSVAGVLTAGMATTKVRDSLIDAERRLYLYAWHMRHLAPGIKRTPTAKA